MPLTDAETTAIADRISLRVLERMEEHRKNDHEPLERRVSKLENWRWWMIGGMGVAALVFDLIRH